MERESNPMQPMCRSGCGFYGNPATDGLCSVCYKDSLRKKQQPPVSSTTVTVSTPQTTPTYNSPDLTVTNTAQPTVQSYIQPHHEIKEKTTDESSKDNLVSTAGPSNTTNEQEDKEDSKDGQKKKNRCATCRKKVGLTGFECRCGGLFCAVHRYSDKHNCTFDYREHGAQEIRRNNPVVVGEKIQKI